MKSAILSIASLLVFASVGFAATSSSADYSIQTDVIDSGGAAASSVNYSTQGSAGAVAGSSVAPDDSGFMRHGFLGQIYERVGFGLLAVPATVDETGTRQILGGDVMDDGTLLTVEPATNITWAIMDGPLTGISAAGLVTADIVALDTPAMIQGTLGPDTATLSLSVLNTIADNFGTYAGDGLADDFQVEFFGFDNPLAAPGLDADGDGQSNQFEWTAGLSPVDRAERFSTLLEMVDGQLPVTFGPCLPGRTYTLQFSDDLSPESWLPVPGAIVLPADENGYCTAIDPDPADTHRFYRVEILRE